MKKLVYIISFFSFSGYYTGLAILISLGLSTLSRQYSTPLRILMALIMVYIIITNRNRLFAAKNNSVIPLFLIFWAYYFIKVLYTELIVLNDSLVRPWEEYIYYPLIFVILPFITFISIPFHKYWKTILNALIFSGFLLGVICTYLYGPYLLVGGFGRLSALTYETGENVLSPLAASYAGSLTLMLCLFKLIILKTNGKLEKLYLLITLVLSLILFLMGSSRGSLLALIFTLPLLVFYSDIKAKKLKFFLMGSILVPLFFLAVDVSGSNLFKRLENTAEDQGGGRFIIWKNSLNHFYDNPIFGGQIEIGGAYPHNFFVELLMATGIIGALIMIPILIRGFSIAFKKVKENPIHLFWVILLFQGLTQYLFSGSFAMATLFFLPLGLAYGLKDHYMDKQFSN